jgi:UDP-glucose 4-epimerase
VLTHHHRLPTKPTRIIVLGARGFIGRTLAARLVSTGAEVISLGRQDLDLEHSSAASQLAGRLASDDTLVFVSAKAPVRDVPMLRANIHMAETVVTALSRQKVAHVVYVSSDAVYADSSEPLTEHSSTAPGSLHGVMHLARELALTQTLTPPIGILRPTLIYGAGDPHNGYGPNRFRRLASEGRDITLFGQGEERRDHILVDDVAELLQRMIHHRSSGILNAATGRVTSFRTIAEYVVGLADASVAITGTPRHGTMPHNGYRAFDPAATSAAFPDFRYTPLEEGLAKVAQSGEPRG